MFPCHCNKAMISNSNKSIKIIMSDEHDPKYGEPYGEPSPRELAIDEGSSASRAYCISSYGAIMLLSECNATQLEEILSDTPPEDLRDMSEMLLNQVGDLVGEPHHVSESEGTIKDYAYKARMLEAMAHRNEENSEVVDETTTPNNRYEHSE